MPDVNITITKHTPDVYFDDMYVDITITRQTLDILCKFISNN